MLCETGREIPYDHQPEMVWIRVEAYTDKGAGDGRLAARRHARAGAPEVTATTPIFSP